jgi:hypothetical protein
LNDTHRAALDGIDGNWAFGELQKIRTMSGFGKILRVCEGFDPSEVPKRTPCAALGTAYSVEALLEVTSSEINRGTRKRDRGASLRSRAGDM